MPQWRQAMILWSMTPPSSPAPWRPPCSSASPLASGPGQQVRRIGSGFGDAGETLILAGPRCASVHGFSLHANTQVPAHRRDQLERLSPVYRPRRGVPGAPDPRRQRRSRLHLHPSLVRWHHGGFGSRPWSSWRSWQLSCPCHASTWCALAAVWRRTATCVGCSPGWAAPRGAGRHPARAPAEKSGTGWADAGGGKGRLIII